MVLSFLRILTVAIGALTVATATVEASTDKRIALVIGNARYPDAPLRNAANDARAMATTLRERGFEVILAENATRLQMEKAILDFGEKLSEGATGVFFFAGHGIQVQGRYYIIPTDARLSSEQRVKLETVDVEAVLDQMQGARSKVNVVILDACRNNPFERRFRSASGGLAQISAPEGTLIAYATAPGKVAADGDGQNGLYTSELLKALQAPGLKVEDVFKQVRTNVTRASNGAQIPWEASSLVGDFFFSPPTPVATTPSNAIELEFWNAIKNSSVPAELKAYLGQFPNGQFASLIRARLEVLETTTVTQARSVTAAPQQAALPGSGYELDGKYQAILSGATWRGGDIPASMEIIGQRIAGTVFHGAPCAFTGRLNRDGVAEIRIDCPRVYNSSITYADPIVIQLEGRFGPRDGNLEIVGDTTFRTSDRRTGKVIWHRSPP